ncbi:MAG TPA: TlyA family RNA methyltransferase [Bryobacteraceae bacterium]|jgi:23S rRNA (cytidine1920-2'-O)/16S rRNA (cytidine1409-2'-O)-methyltransferase
MTTGRVSRERLDRQLVERGFAESREKAQALIMAGEVLVDGRKAEKPGVTVARDCQIELLARPRFVGRGGIKLQAALEHFQVNVTGMVCLDVGASTGGFTDCLLQNGAARVHAVDVGHGQLDWKLRNDARVSVYEGLNARGLTVGDVGEQVDLAVCDVSFISVTLIVPAIAGVLKERAGMIVLVKPQFEAGREQVGKGGIVRDPAVQQAACDRVAAAVEEMGFRWSAIDSPIAGAEGNREILLHAYR